MMKNTKAITSDDGELIVDIITDETDIEKRIVFFRLFCLIQMQTPFENERF